MIFDIITIMIFVLLIVINVRRGAAAALSRIIIMAASCFASSMLGKLLASAVYGWFVQPAVERTVSDAIANASTDAADNVVSALPSWLTNLLNLSGDDLTELFADPLSSAKGTFTQSVNAAVKPVATTLMTILFTIILYFIIALILRKIFSRILCGIFRFALLNIVDRVLGAVIGLFEAIILVSLLSYLVRLYLTYVGSNSTWFNTATINNSFIFSLFYSGNIFSWITAWIKG